MFYTLPIWSIVTLRDKVDICYLLVSYVSVKVFHLIACARVYLQARVIEDWKTHEIVESLEQRLEAA